MRCMKESEQFTEWIYIYKDSVEGFKGAMIRWKVKKCKRDRWKDEKMERRSGWLSEQEKENMEMKSGSWGRDMRWL